MKSPLLLLLAVLLLVAARAAAQNLVYVDNKGVLRYTKSKQEAAFFGVNYTVPFAYGYRSHKVLGVEPEQAIRQDVYHFARLGLDAFRVHVWDTEITDSSGNLLENEHLRLFDFLIHELKQRNIKIFLTPLAFWGSGYPEPDIKTGSFSSIYSKQQVLVQEPAIRAQENYIRQLLLHVNPYTKQTYGQDSDIIALEINNEPHHSGPKQQAKNYIDRMVRAVRGSGWTKPVFYNISESPAYADVVAAASIEGVSFQWYPTGLVANRTHHGNLLPHVDQYAIPFDTVAAYRNKARMVYEFDAGDVLQSYMYPAMVRSFRTAGFQWATQFAYDPLHTAYGNTEYQTHYLNLAYTPSKAVSLLIASKAFHRLPRGKSFGTYPADTLFDVFRVSYQMDLSEMNTAEEFYYSNHTHTKPLDAGKLKHIAGVGQSPVVRFAGTGAYFLDKISEGVWRLEVMPDAVPVRDPFEKASPRKEVTRVQWALHPMEIFLPGLPPGFHISPLNEGNSYRAAASGNKFFIRPGAYLLGAAQAARPVSAVPGCRISAHEFVAPPSSSSTPLVFHVPFREVIAGQAFTLSAKLAGIDSSDRVVLELRNSANLWKTVPMTPGAGHDFEGTVPADMVRPGILEYRVLVRRKDNSYISAPGHHTGDPYAWDNITRETWETWVVPASNPVRLFNAGTDRNRINLYNPDWRRNAIAYTSTPQPGELALRASLSKAAGNERIGFEHYCAAGIRGRGQAADRFQKIMIRGLAEKEPMAVTITLVMRDATAFSARVILDTAFGEKAIPLEAFKASSFLLLPRPYPGFLPLWFRTAAASPMRVSDVEKVQLLFGGDLPAGSAYAVQVASISLQ